MTEPRRTTRVASEFAAMFDRCNRDVFRYCFALTRRVEDAEDVTAEVFERGLRAWQADGGDHDRSLPWLLLVARRILIDRARRKRLIRWLPLPADPMVVGSSADSDRVEFWLWFDRLAEALTSRQREVLLLRYQSDLTDAEIGRILGLTEAGVRSLAARAIAALRQHPELLR